MWGVPPRAAGAIERADRPPSAGIASAWRWSRAASAALTRYRLEEAIGRLAARLRLELATGRTHQIRVHLGTLGLGIVGDPVYRPRRRTSLSPALKEQLAGFGRIALHARVLGFEHPVSGAALRFERAGAAGVRRLLELLRAEAGLYGSLTKNPLTKSR